MELFQELVFTISFSLIVSLLIAKLFSVSSSSDDNSTLLSSSSSIMVEEKEWVVCDSEKHDHDHDDQLQVTENIVFGSYDGDLGSGVVIDDLKNVGGVDETSLSTEFEDNRIGVGSLKNDEEGDGVVESVLGSLVQEECVKDVEVEQDLLTDEAEFDDDDDDDWQGIETTDLEKTFGAAVAFMGSKSSADRVNLIDNDVKIELYGLHRVANEGSCFEPQPMALKVSARANWNAWKRLENLGRDDAMEQYINLLSRHVPDWMESHASVRNILFRRNNDMKL